LNFNGQPFTPLLALSEADDSQNQFYWSGTGHNSDHTMTRTFDLRDVEEATLVFDSWYDLADNWNYSYIEVSDDGGVTWTVLRATDSSLSNGNGVAYGPGFTGISTREEPGPFPFLGVSLAGATDGLEIQELFADGPAVASDLLAGDVIVGYDEQLWPGGNPDILGVLATYKPGDTINLYIRRNRDYLSIPLVLGEHPERRFIPQSEWLTQEVDLTAYSGQEIAVRFEYLSLPNTANDGIAIDNIAIPEIGYLDRVEVGRSNWTLRGWERVENSVPQRFLLQVATVGADNVPSRVRRLIGPQDDRADGEWRFAFEADEQFIIAISGLNDETTQRATFDLTITRDGEIAGA
jgi:hypothetical protein